MLAEAGQIDLVGACLFPLDTCLDDVSADMWRLVLECMLFRQRLRHRGMDDLYGDQHPVEESRQTSFGIRARASGVSVLRCARYIRYRRELGRRTPCRVLEKDDILARGALAVRHSVVVEAWGSCR